MKTKPSNRVLAAVMALVMVLLMVPFSPMQTNAVANTYTLDAATLAEFAAGAKADGAKEVSADGFFTLQWSASSSIAGGVIDFGANGSTSANSIAFTVPEGATATLKVSWVKKTDDAKLTVFKADGNYETNFNNTLTVAGGTVTNTYRNTLAAGTYYVASEDNNATIKYVTVTVTTPDPVPEETPAPETTPAPTQPSGGASGSVVFDPDTQVALGTDKDVIAAGTTFTDGFFAVEGTVKQRVKNGSVYCVELLKKNQGAIVFTTTDVSTVTVVFSSTGGTNVSAVALLDASGNTITEDAGQTTVTGTADTAFTYTNLPAGTYKASCPETARDCRLHRITVAYGGGEVTPEPPQPEETPAPETTPAPTTPAPTTPTPTTVPETPVEPPVSGGEKIDVWDFGFEVLDETKYNNLLTVEKANANFYVNGSVGSEGVVNSGNTMGDWSIDGGDFAFAAGGKTNHRLRVNAAIEGLTAHSSGKYLTDDNGVTYNGFLYSNSGANTGVQILVKANAGDILTFVHGSNGGNADVVFESPSGLKTLDTFTAGANSAHGEVSTFYCDVDGVYKFYYTSEKLVVARVTRQHTKEISVTGNVTAPAELTGYSLVFTCNESGAVVEAPVAGGTYSATLREGYSYTVSLKDANGYVINTGKELAIASGAASATLDVEIISVDLVTVTGNITGLDAEAMAALKLSFTADAIYVPEITITGTAYTVELEKGISYTLVAEGINDYEITSGAAVSYDADATADIVFAAKPTYAITIAPTGCTLADLAGATFTFTNLNEEGYVYTFTGPDAIALRDGVYEVKVSGAGIYVQKLTSNLKVEGAAVIKTIPFNGDITVWNFADEDWAGTSPYNGLTFDNGKKDKTYLLANGAGTIQVPVKGACQIKISACYQYSFESDTADSQDKNTGSTSQIDTYTLTYNGEAGMAAINVLGKSYITKIEVVEVVAYKDTITVGASGCDYTTINDALAAVKAMERPNNERVTIAIQPGNYEEMLVIDTPNVTLKNASSAPSLELTNEGVDIAANAVRITHYYGHGYDYYSMGADCKWDAEILAVNKENGYASNTNPGSGTTRGSYWNATVVILANGVEAEGIIFENSFNQYVSQKASEDIIVNNGGAKEGAVARGDLSVSSTAVQDKKYVERAAALAIGNNVKQVSFDNCKFIGRQDTLYGGTGATVAFYDCAIYGGTDYIFGGMTAVFAKCDLVANTMEDGNDKFYITAAQTPAGSHGLLMYNCHVTSTVPGKDTASTYTSKPGQFGRPWAADSGEAVFYCTIIDAADTHWYESHGASLIDAEGWNSSLSGQSALSVEYGTYEYAKDCDNSANRVSWAGVLTEPVLANGEPISVETWFGSWDPFAGKDMTVVVPTDKVDNKPVEEQPPVTPPAGGEDVSYVLDVTADLTSFAQGDKADGDIGTVKDYFNIFYSAKNKVDGSNKTFDDGYVATQRLNFGGKTDPAKGMINSVQFKTENPATVKVWWVSGGDGRTMAIYDSNNAVLTATTAADSVKNSLYITEFELTEAGTYALGVPEGSNYLFKLEVIEHVPAVSEPQEYVLDATADLTAFAQGDKADGDIDTIKDFFNVYYSAKNKVDGSNKTFDDGYTASQRLNFGGKTDPAKGMINSVQFTVDNKGTAKIWWVSGGDGRTMAIYDANGNVLSATAAADSVKNSLYISELEIPAAGTYFVGVPEGSNYLFKLQVNVEGGGVVDKPERADWANVAAPEITGITSENGDVKVTVNANVGYDGADEVIVTMYDAQGNEIASKRSIAEKGEHTLTFQPTASGDYTFKAEILREGEENKAAALNATYTYSLPLEAPVISSATSVGAGGVEVVWNAAQEAESYNVYVDGALAGNTADLKYTVTGLTVGTKYSFTVEAVRGEDRAMSDAISATATEKAQRVWSTTTYGPSTSSGNGVVGDMNEDGQVTVYSEGGKGKLQYKDSDGLTYYYTAIPEDKNFTFRVKVHIDSWKYSNGQEGFGIMATDRVAPNGASTWWSNQYMAMISKVEYKYDHATGEIFHTDVAANVGVKYDLRLGVGTNAKLGITPENLSLIESNDAATIISCANGVTYPLDISIAKEHSNGKYNTTGNCVDPAAVTKAGYETIEENTDFILEIQRNNTGYFITYYDANGNIIGQQKNFDPKALSHLDTENVYVGFFAARNARATFTIEELSTIDPADDAPAEEIPVTYVTPTLSFVGAGVSTTGNYVLSLNANVAGTAKIKLNDKVIAEAAVLEGDVRFDLPIDLNVDGKEGNNRFYIDFYPDPDQDLGENMELANADKIFLYKKIQYNTKYADREFLYVDAYYGEPDGLGTRGMPLDLATALKNVKPGQTIVLMGQFTKSATYKFAGGLTIERGISGTADKPIRMIADPEAKVRPVIDFKGTGSGFSVRGDYWYMEGFDVRNSVSGKPGIHVSGSNNTLVGLETYNNGNSGIQLSRNSSFDLKEEWPSNNLILNCTSYNNADAGMEDADGFAAKLTCGPGNVFDGCVAHHNADDGWDLYAKVDTGEIGAVTIKNCVAYSNGYLLDGTNAGNGNGFKMGGSNVSGAHKLINSYAFFNKAKGIDSNSGPNIIVENCTSYNNESYNVAFYTNINQNTAYDATGIISYKDDTVKSGYDKYDNLKPRGTQDNSKIFNDTNYYWLENGAVNNSGAAITGDIFVTTEFNGVNRNEDGTIDLQGFLQIKEDSGITGGAKPEGTPSAPPVNPDQPGETTPPETTPEETQPGETTPPETTPEETQPGETTKPEDTKPTDPSNPGTGDSFNGALWAVLMLAAAFGMVMVPATMRKRKF